jgi:hypothetical protein
MLILQIVAALVLFQELPKLGKLIGDILAVLIQARHDSTRIHQEKPHHEAPNASEQANWDMFVTKLKGE